jgi:hypothetical protein
MVFWWLINHFIRLKHRSIKYIDTAMSIETAQKEANKKLKELKIKLRALSK